MVRNEEITLLAARALTEAAPSLSDIAERIGVSYDAVRSWRTSRRTPQKEHMLSLAAALDDQADKLRGLAQDLRRQAEEPDD